MNSFIKKQKANITLVSLCAELVIPFALYATIQNHNMYIAGIIFLFAFIIKFALILAG